MALPNQFERFLLFKSTGILKFLSKWHLNASKQKGLGITSKTASSMKLSTLSVSDINRLRL